MHPSEKPAPGPSDPAARVFGAIPARYGSRRLPGKALRELAGRPMIEHVYRRALEARGLERVVVLTDDERIAAAVAAFGGECQMTPAECASGTDRVAWAARGWDAAAVVNIQGDEPLIDPRAITRLAGHLAGRPGDPIVTLAAPAAAEDPGNPDVVKVVVDHEGRALYFSRAPIPFPRGEGGRPPLRHVGIYGYQREALLALAALEPSPLERAESLEQLRALEHGIPIRVLETDGFWWGVDTMEDLARTEEFLRRRQAAGATPKG